MDERTRDEGAEPEEGDVTETTAGLSRNAVFDVLRSERRRAVVRHLHTTDGAASLDELRRAVSDSFAADSPACHCGVDVRLHHVHLPKLDHAGVVDYDRSEKTARLREGCEPMFDVLSLEDDR